MIKGHSATVLLALAAACGGGAVQGPAAPGARPLPTVASAPLRYEAGGPWSYVYLRTDTVIAFLPNGGQQLQVVERRLQVRWETAEVPGGLALTLTIDSAHVVGPTAARALEDSARGTVIRGNLTTGGRLSALVTTGENGVTRTLLAALPWLVPALPPSIHEGSAIEDTLDATVPLGIVDAAERTQRRVTAGGAPGTLELTGTVSRTGASAQLELQGTGSRMAHAEFTASGRLLSLTGRDSVTMDATAAATGQSVRLLQIGTYTLTPSP